MRQHFCSFERFTSKEKKSIVLFKTEACGKHFQVFPSINCPNRGVKDVLVKSLKVPTGEFSAFTIKSLQNNTSHAISKSN